MWVEFENISVTFDDGATRALTEVSVRFEPKTLTLVTGPSGCGKTTLLSVGGLLCRPDQGELRLLGETSNFLTEEQKATRRLRSLGFVFQSSRLLEAITGIENVMLPLELLGYPRTQARRRALDLLDRVGMENHAALYPRQLSGGQRQRIAIARALAADPPILLADEPTASLDTDAGEMVISLLRRLVDEDGRLVVVVSHDSKWNPIADRIIRMQDGRIEEDTFV